MHTFVETKLSKLVQEYLADDEYAELQRSLIARPDAGDVIPGSREGQIWMLTIYAKNETENISAGVLKKIKEEIDGTR